MPKELRFRGDSRRRLREFPVTARGALGAELWRVQEGLEPSDWKPMATIGTGVREIRVRDTTGAYRVVYIATLPEAVYVLHAFQKKTPKTARGDLELAKDRLRGLVLERK